MRIAATLALLLSFAACEPPRQTVANALPGSVPVQGVRVVRQYPHDAQAFTQGLLFADGRLYESTGLVGHSTIREVNLEDGRVIRSVDIPQGLFGEGIVAWGNEILSITWRDGVGFRWDRATFRQTGSWRYNHEGWGLTQDGRHIILSDGTADLRFLDPATMAEQSRITVTAAGAPVDRLNELEYVNGEILANIWQTGRIARIDPSNGQVKGWIDLEPLVRQSGDSHERVLNGIAWNPHSRRLFVTGKNWSKLYEIELLPPAANQP
jgi:glutamine cyclotransferase